MDAASRDGVATPSLSAALALAAYVSFAPICLGDTQPAKLGTPRIKTYILPPYLSPKPLFKHIHLQKGVDRARKRII